MPVFIILESNKVSLPLGRVAEYLAGHIISVYFSLLKLTWSEQAFLSQVPLFHVHLGSINSLWMSSFQMYDAWKANYFQHGLVLLLGS